METLLPIFFLLFTFGSAQNEELGFRMLMPGIMSVRTPNEDLVLGAPVGDPEGRVGEERPIQFPSLPFNRRGDTFGGEPVSIVFSSQFEGESDLPPVVEERSAGKELTSNLTEEVVDLPEDLNLDNLNVTDLKRISEASTVEDFVALMGIELPEEEAPLEEDDTFSLSSRNNLPFSGTPTLRLGGPLANAQVARPAACQVENSTVELQLPRKPNTLYFPTCVRLPRCSGCCTSKHLSCQPTKTVTHTFKVLQVSPSNGPRPIRQQPRGNHLRDSNRSRRRKRTLSKYFHADEVEHVACGCQCRVQKNDCDPKIHFYDANNCRCNCLNSDEHAKCTKRDQDHYWDPKSCKCLCHKVQDCSTNQYFDHFGCTCQNL